MNLTHRLLVILLLALCACSHAGDDPTQIVLEVDSDLRVPEELDRVSVELEGAQADGASADLARQPFPRSLGLVHAGGPLGPFTVRVVGTRDGAVVVESSRSVTFQAHGTVRVAVFLASACRDVACTGGETCVDGSCEAMADADAGVPGSESDASDSGGRDTSTGDASGDGAIEALCAIEQPIADDTFQSGASFVAKGQCAGPAGNVAASQLSWSSDQEGALAVGASPSLVLRKLGVHRLSLCTSSGDGCAEVSVTVSDVAQPSASITSVSQGSNQRSPFHSESPIVLRGAASGAGVSVSWSDNLQGQLGSGIMATLDAPQVGRHTVTLTATDRSGRTSSASTTFVVLAPGQTTLVEPLGSTILPITSVTELIERNATTLYIARGSLGVYELDLALPLTATPVLTAPAVSGSVQSALLDVSHGLFYLGTSAGLTVCLYADSSGPSDCATYQGGQLPSNNVTALLRLPGSPDQLLVGTDSGLFLADNPAGGTTGSVRPSGRAIRALAGDRNTAWLATDQGLYRLPLAGGNASRVNAGGASTQSWNAVQLGSGGVVWLGGGAGLARYDPNADSWSYWKAADGLISNAVSALGVETRLVNGSARELVWIATSAGVSRFDPQQGSFQSFTMADGLPSNDVGELLVMRNGSKVFATSAGLARYQGW